MNILKVALIGFGGIARSHNTAYQELATKGVPVSLVAVCDKNVEQFRSSITINLGTTATTLPQGIHTYADADELLANEDFDVADICLPSYLHKEYTIKMLRAGKHVLCEKPMALNSADCEEMIATAKECDRKLMVGQCLRFDSNYRYLKSCIESDVYGKLKILFMNRLSQYPKWGFEKWFENIEKCGGCIMDTHIHDIDIAQFLLGKPQTVSTVAYDNLPHCQIVNTRLLYAEQTVIADAAWDETRLIPFEAGFHAKFEEASVIYNGTNITVFPNGKDAIIPYVPQTDRIAEEIRFFVMWITDPRVINTDNSPESSKQSIELVEYLCKSASLNGKYISI